jgi:hypothetical protein
VCSSVEGEGGKDRKGEVEVEEEVRTEECEEEVKAKDIG